MKLPPKTNTPNELLRAARQLAEQGKLDNSEASLVESLASQESSSEHDSTALLDILGRHRDELSTDQKASLNRVTGLAENKVPLNVIDISGKAVTKKSYTPATTDVGSGPQASLTERRVLEDLLHRHGESLDGQLRNLVVGFLRTLPQEEDPQPQGTELLGALAQVVALRGGQQSIVRQLNVDPESTVVPLQEIEQMLDANASRGHLLVATGVASQEELVQLNSGEMTLGDFYRLAAKGHFGERSQQPVTYDELRRKLLDAGLEIDFHRLVGDLSLSQREQMICGELTPVEIFTLLAKTRGKQDSQE